MYTSTKEFNTAIYNILTDINKSVPINDISQKFTATDFDEHLNIAIIMDLSME